MFSKKQKDLSPTSIPVMRERRSSGFSSISDMSEHERSLVNMERKMDEEVAKVLNEWDENIENTTFSVRSLKPHKDRNEVVNSSSGRHSPRLPRSPRPAIRRLDFVSPHSRSTSPMPVNMCVDTSSLSSGHSSVFDTSSESLDEDCKRPLYSICPMTGRKMFRMHFDVQGYHNEDVRVKVNGQKLVIFAMRRENKSGRKSTSEFCRKLKIPEDVEVEKLQSTITNGVLCIEGPVQPKTHKSDSGGSLAECALDKALYNVPQIKDTEKGKVLTLLAEIGPLFKNDDIVVQLKGTHRLIIRAERQENNMHGSMSAQLTREFDLPRRIRPQSLRAGLATTGVLSLVADVIDSRSSANHANGKVGEPNPSSTQSHSVDVPSST